MTTRRAFLASAAALGMQGVRSSAEGKFISQRPPVAQRKFTSAAVEQRIVDIKKTIADPELGWMFENCFPNTLDTTVRAGELDGKPDTFVITGDIDAMWLRDSTAQVWPYLPLARQDPALQRMLAGVIRRQTRCVLIDPYANAFNFGPTGSPWAKDLTRMKPELHERKWEIDSLCFPVRLAHGYWKATSDVSCFDADWQKATEAIVQTFREQQRMKNQGPYRFQRSSPVASDSLPNDGYGNPGRPCGLIHSGFRPSDDACIFPFLIPSNFFAVTALEQLQEIHGTVLKNAAFARQCGDFAAELREALTRYAKATHPRRGEIYAFEVDGYGSALLMDDAGMPGLLAMPYLGSVAAQDATYRNTRAFSLSEDNPFFYRGRAAEGLGSPHAGLGMIWPLGIIGQALTSTDEKEIGDCLAALKATHNGSGFMHESFDRNNAAHFTRPWFAWANTLFGELILTVAEKHPRLLRA